MISYLDDWTNNGRSDETLDEIKTMGTVLDDLRMLDFFEELHLG
jgi:hypothetical protein